MREPFTTFRTSFCRGGLVNRPMALLAIIVAILAAMSSGHAHM